MDYLTRTAQSLDSLSSAQLPATDLCIVEGRAHTSSALFELRSFDWRDLHEGSVVPPSSYLELTQIRAVGRYGEEQHEHWRDLGSVRYHPAGNEFHCRWYEDRQTALLCAFNTTDVMGYDIDINSSYLAQTHDLKNPYLFNLLARAQQEIASPGLVSEVILESLGNAIVSEWQKQFSAFLDFPQQRFRGDQFSKEQAHRIIAKVREQRNMPTIAELACEQGVSAKHFNRLFKQATGEAVSEAFKRARVERAKDLLINSRVLIKEVAYQCGFENSASFCKSFRSSVGMSPQNFRHQAS